MRQAWRWVSGLWVLSLPPLHPLLQKQNDLVETGAASASAMACRASCSSFRQAILQERLPVAVPLRPTPLLGGLCGWRLRLEPRQIPEALPF